MKKSFGILVLAAFASTAAFSAPHPRAAKAARSYLNAALELAAARAERRACEADASVGEILSALQLALKHDPRLSKTIAQDATLSAQLSKNIVYRELTGESFASALSKSVFYSAVASGAYGALTIFTFGENGRLFIQEGRIAEHETRDEVEWTTVEATYELDASRGVVVVHRSDLGVREYKVTQEGNGYRSVYGLQSLQDKWDALLNEDASECAE